MERVELTYHWAAPEEMHDALASAGFVEIALRDRAAWFADLLGEEIKKLEAGPMRADLIRATDEESAEGWLVMEAAGILRQTAGNLPDTDPGGQSSLTLAALCPHPISSFIREREPPRRKESHMNLRKSLEAFTADFEKAIASGDAETVSEFFTEDGMFLLQGRPVVRGKVELVSMFQGWIDSKQAVRHEILTCEEDGDLAYATGTFSAQYQNDQGETDKFSGKYIDVFRRQPGGPWKCHASCAFAD